MVIHVPDEMAHHLVEEARRRGVFPESLALAGIRSMLPDDAPPAPKNLLEFLGKHVGAVSGSGPDPAESGTMFAEHAPRGEPVRP